MLRETFKRPPLMGDLRRHVGDNRDLLVILAAPLNAAGGGDMRTGTIRRHQQLSIQLFAARQRDADAILPPLNPADRFRAAQRHAGALRSS